MAKLLCANTGTETALIWQWVVCTSGPSNGYDS